MRGRLKDAVLAAGLLLSAGNSWSQEIEVDFASDIGPQEELSPESFPAYDFRKHLTASLLYQKVGPRLGSINEPSARVWMLAESRLGDRPDFLVGVYGVYDYSGAQRIFRYAVLVRELSAPRGEAFQAALKIFPESLRAESPAQNAYTAEQIRKSLDQMTAVMNGLSVSTCQIDAHAYAGIMRRVESVWTRVLFRTSFDRHDNPDAGSGIHFGNSPYIYRFTDGFGGSDYFNDIDLTGVAGHENDETRPGLMIGSALAMRDFCKFKDTSYLVVLSQKLDALEKRLPKETEP